MSGNARRHGGSLRFATARDTRAGAYETSRGHHARHARSRSPSTRGASLSRHAGSAGARRRGRGRRHRVRHGTGPGVGAASSSRSCRSTGRRARGEAHRRPRNELYRQRAALREERRTGAEGGGRYCGAMPLRPSLAAGVGQVSAARERRGKSRAPQGRVPGNAWGARAHGKCTQRRDRLRASHGDGKGEKVG